MVHWPGDDDEDVGVSTKHNDVITHPCPRTGVDIADWDFQAHVAQFSTKISSNLYLGNNTNAFDMNQLNHKNDKITHILNIQRNGTTPFSENKELTYKVQPLDDLPAERLIDILPETFKFINGAVNGGGKVLVHCDTGTSRAAAVVIGYLMKTKKTTYKKALATVNSCRKDMFQPSVKPNHGFVRQLRQYEKQMR